MAYWLPKVSALSDVRPDTVARVHHSLSKLPRYVTEALWSANVGVGIRADFPWDEGETYSGQVWRECGGYWNGDTRYAVINAEWCKNQGYMDAVVHHELGHALSLEVLDAPHRRPEFREAWSAGRRTIKKRWPADYEARENMGVLCLHWTRGVQEVWAEAFTWLQGSRAVTHGAFGEVFETCLALVEQELSDMRNAAA